MWLGRAAKTASWRERHQSGMRAVGACCCRCVEICGLSLQVQSDAGKDCLQARLTRGVDLQGLSGWVVPSTWLGSLLFVPMCLDRYFGRSCSTATGL